MKGIISVYSEFKSVTPVHYSLHITRCWSPQSYSRCTCLLRLRVDGTATKIYPSVKRTWHVHNIHMPFCACKRCVHV